MDDEDILPYGVSARLQTLAVVFALVAVTDVLLAVWAEVLWPIILAVGFGVFAVVLGDRAGAARRSGGPYQRCGPPEVRHGRARAEVVRTR